MRVPSTGRWSAVIVLACLLWAGIAPVSAAWQPPAPIDGGENYAWGSRIAADDAGNAVAVWGQSDESANYQVIASHWNGSEWSVPERIDNGVGNVQWDAQIALDGAGNGFAVWEQQDDVDGGYRIYARRWDGSAWSGAVRLDTGTDDAINPRIALNDTGEGVVIWMQYDAENDEYNIYGSRWNGSTWSSPSYLGTGYNWNPSVALDAAGNAIVVWSTGLSEAGVDAVFSTHWDGVSTDTRTLSDLSEDAYDPQIAVNEAGSAIVVWESYGGTIDRDIYARRWDGSAWSGAELISTGSGAGYDSQIALDDAGNAVAAWREVRNMSSSIYVNRWDGSAWSGAELIDAGTGLTYNPRITHDGAGNWVAVWRQLNGARFRVHASRGNGSGWSTPVPIDDGAAMTYGPQIALDGTGNGFAVWGQGTATVDRIYAARYLADWTLDVARAGAGTGSVTADSGAIDCGGTCSGVYETGTTVVLTAAPDAGSAFDGWQGCDSTNGSECTVTLTSDTTVTASFRVAGTETVDWGGADASGDGGGQAGSVPAEDDWRFAPSSTGLLETRGFLTLEEAQAAGLVTGVPPGGMQVFGRLFAFTLIGGETGGTAVVTIDYGQPIPAGAQYWKYFEDGELFGPPEGAGWYRFDGAVIDHAAGTVTLTLTDGEFGDADWVANAVIRDPGGLFTQAEPVPTLSQWAMLLLVMLLGAVGTNAVGQVALSRNLTYGHDG